VDSIVRLLTTHETFLREVGGKAPLLSPAKLSAIGFLVLATGVGLFFDVRARFLPVLPWTVMLVGLAVITAGAFARRNRLRFERELADVLTRWDVLVTGVRAAEAEGKSPARYLQAQGVRRYEVRRFVLQKLREGAAAGTAIGATGATAGAWLPASLRTDGRGGRPRAEPPAGPRWLGRS
jgi:hypothetical protein